jgi:hypothetical protein
MSCESHRLAVFALVVMAFVGLVVGQTSSLLADEPTGVREDGEVIVDRFQGAISKEWRWLRENRQGWRLTDSGLQVLIEPGNMWGNANDAKNVLLRAVPEAWHESVEISVQMEQHPKKRWEQTNLVWYYSDSTMVKLGLEIEHGRTNVVMGREVDDRTQTIAIIPYPGETVQLRLVVDGLEVTGFYREPGAETWTEVGKATLPEGLSKPPQVSLQFYQGEAESQRWATVTDFRMQPGR